MLRNLQKFLEIPRISYNFLDILITYSTLSEIFEINRYDQNFQRNPLNNQKVLGMLCNYKALLEIRSGKIFLLIKTLANNNGMIRPWNETKDNGPILNSQKASIIDFVATKTNNAENIPF